MTYTPNPYLDVPVSILGQEKYIAEGGPLFEKLARLWECGAVQAGHRGEETIPDAEGKRRWSQFWTIWERVAGQPKPARDLAGPLG